jgi:hypothetical protein
MGHADEVLQLSSVAECLDMCLQWSSFVCRSVIYFYDRNECILNRASQFTKPLLFVDADEKQSPVDYFDNVCMTLPDYDEDEMVTPKIQLATPGASGRTLAAIDDVELTTIEAADESIEDDENNGQLI